MVTWSRPKMPGPKRRRCRARAQTLKTRMPKPAPFARRNRTAIGAGLIDGGVVVRANVGSFVVIRSPRNAPDASAMATVSFLKVICVATYRQGAMPKPVPRFDPRDPAMLFQRSSVSPTEQPPGRARCTSTKAGSRSRRSSSCTP